MLRLSCRKKEKKKNTDAEQACKCFFKFLFTRNSWDNLFFYTKTNVLYLKKSLKIQERKKTRRKHFGITRENKISISEEKRKVSFFETTNALSAVKFLFISRYSHMWPFRNNRFEDSYGWDSRKVLCESQLSLPRGRKVRQMQLRCCAICRNGRAKSPDIENYISWTNGIWVFSERALLRRRKGNQTSRAGKNYSTRERVCVGWLCKVAVFCRKSYMYIYGDLPEGSVRDRTLIRATRVTRDFIWRRRRRRLGMSLNPRWK